jgi:orotate phosphoribosyltransferase
VPIVSVVCAKSFERRRPLQGFFVRKAAKDHGTGKLIEGNLTKGARVAILEDVTTACGSALEAVEAVSAFGASAVVVIAVIDRLEGAAAAFRARDLPFVALFTRDDFLSSGQPSA